MILLGDEKMQKSINLKYGLDKVELKIDEGKIKGIISSKEIENKDYAKIITEALENPIGSDKLREIVNTGETVTLVISDITRSWQNIDLFLPFIIGELQAGGIKLKDITVLSAAGSHRNHTEAEKEKLLGSRYYGKINFKDHEAENKDDLTFLGTTSYGTPVFLNKALVEADRVVLTGGIVFHNLAGFAGGRKSLLPGTAAYQSIMKNHSLSLAEKRGDGLKSTIESNILKNNPVHEDMMEAAQFIETDFILNVIPDGKGGIANVVAGDLELAHQEGCRICRELFGINMKEKADLVIASAGGFPKDMNLYQSSKALVNAAKAVKKDGYLILLADCKEGIGHPEVEDIIQNYENRLAREDFLREDFTIARYVGYLITAETEDINCILVSNIKEDSLSTTDIKITDSIEDALKIVEEEIKELPESYIFPNAANTLPVFK